MIERKNIVISDEQIEFLANCYVKLQENPTYRNLSKTFQSYMSEFLDRELLKIQRCRLTSQRKGR